MNTGSKCFCSVLVIWPLLLRRTDGADSEALSPPKPTQIGQDRCCRVGQGPDKCPAFLLPAPATMGSTA
ncbi:hypothetical protein BaRGS_00028926, partial [Batillaria attramentaria]